MIGTTGKPKGVDIRHSNVCNLVCLEPGNLGMTPGLRVSQVCSLAVVIIITALRQAHFPRLAPEHPVRHGSMGMSWGVGKWMHACYPRQGLESRTPDVRHSFKRTRTTWIPQLTSICCCRVNIVISTPTIIQPYEPSEFPNIVAVATAGEPCPQQLADKWAVAGALFHNSCGPTEVCAPISSDLETSWLNQELTYVPTYQITIVNTVQPHTTPGYPLSIGVPTPNNSVYVLDEDMKPVPIGQAGMMWAGGAGIARSYIGIHSNKFQRDPFLNDGYDLRRYFN